MIMRTGIDGIIPAADFEMVVGEGGDFAEWRDRDCAGLWNGLLRIQRETPGRLAALASSRYRHPDFGAVVAFEEDCELSHLSILDGEHQGFVCRSGAQLELLRSVLNR